MFGTLGGPELFLIFVVALIVFGPRKLPEIGKSLGKMMAEFRKASNDFRSTIESEVEAEKIRDAMRIEAPRTPASPYAPAEAAAAGSPAAEGDTATSPGPTTEAASAAPAAEAAPATGEPAAPPQESGPETVSRQDEPPPVEPK